MNSCDVMAEKLIQKSLLWRNASYLSSLKFVPLDDSQSDEVKNVVREKREREMGRESWIA